MSQCLAANPYPLDYTGGPSYGNSRLFKPFLHWEVPNWPQYPGLAPAVTKRVGTSLPTLDSTPQPAWLHLFTLQECLCSAGSSLGGTQNPEKRFRVLLILLGVCLGKKAWSKHYLEHQGTARSQRVNIYFQPESHFPDLGHFYSQIFKYKIAENHPAGKICKFRHFSVQPAEFTEKKIIKPLKFSPVSSLSCGDTSSLGS